MSTVEQRLKNTQEKLAFLRDKENIQAIIQEDPKQLKYLAIEEEVLKNLISSRQRKVTASLDLGFNLFALFLFGFVTITAFCLFNYSNFSQFTWERKGTEIAMQLGLVTISTLTFLMFISNSKSKA